jgi:Domain of unknown function (DUF4395)
MDWQRTNMTELNIPTKVDQSALRVNQVFIIALLLAAYLLDSVALVLLVAVVMLLGTAVPELSGFKRIYRHVLRPAGIVKPNVIDDRPEPHRFAQGLGGVFVLASTIALLAGASLLGWLLAAIVVVLAALNLFLGFCAGCFVYYQLQKVGVIGE